MEPRESEIAIARSRHSVRLALLRGRRQGRRVMDDAQTTPPLSGTDHPAPAGSLLAGETASASGLTPGWQTTEFWVSILSLVGVFVLILAEKIDAQTGLLILGSVIPGYAISRGLAKRGVLPLTLLVAGLLLTLGGCAGNSPFTAASNPTPGKVPVKVIASANATGNTAAPTHGTDYTGGVQVVFGRGVPASTRRQLLRRLGINYGLLPAPAHDDWLARALRLTPLTPQEAAFWDADLRRQALDHLPRIGPPAAPEGF